MGILWTGKEGFCSDFSSPSSRSTLERSHFVRGFPRRGGDEGASIPYADFRVEEEDDLAISAFPGHADPSRMRGSEAWDNQ